MPDMAVTGGAALMFAFSRVVFRRQPGVVPVINRGMGMDLDLQCIVSGFCRYADDEIAAFPGGDEQIPLCPVSLLVQISPTHLRW